MPRFWEPHNASSKDAPLKALRDGDCFARVIRACPLQAHWLDGQPVTGVLPMAGITDRYHRFVVDAVPVATGLAAVGDAWACTNPSGGREVSLGIIHAQLLRRTVRSHPGDPAADPRARQPCSRTHRVRAPTPNRPAANQKTAAQSHEETITSRSADQC